MTSGPRILIFDLETLPNIVTAFSLKVNGEYINPEAILRERTILCASWKWLGSPKVRSVSVLDARRRGEQEDYKILKRLQKEFNLADAVVAHNGDNFDVPWVHTRSILLGLPPIKPVIQIDTRKIAKARFNFNSNKLDYLGKKLGCGQKIKTDFDLWLNSLEDNKPAVRRRAVKEMVVYNRQDVLLLEQVYLKLRPFVPAKVNHALWAIGNEGVDTCSVCGSHGRLIRRGFSYTRVTIRQNFQCLDCKGWSYKIAHKDQTLPR